MRSVGLVMALAMVAAVLAGCSHGGDPAPVSTATPTSPTPTPPTEPFTYEPAAGVLGPTVWADATAEHGLPACAGDSGSGQGGAPVAAWGDADGDNDTDLAVACPELVLLRNDGGRLVDGTPAALADARAEGLSFGDVDGDRCLDLFAGGAGAAGEAHLWHGDCAGGFGAQPRTLAAGRHGAWADFDRDAHLDLLVSGPGVAGLRGGPDGLAAASLGLVGPAGVRGATWADLSRDLHPELLLAHAGGWTVYRNLGDGTLRDVTASAGLEASGPSWASDAADFDHDGFVDVALAADVSRVWRSAGDGTFVDAGVERRALPQVPGAGGALSRAATAVAFADLNNDGWDDLLWAAPGGLLVLRNLGGHFDAPAPLPGPSGDARSLALGDADADGRLDLWAGFAGGGQALLRNLGPGAAPKDGDEPSLSQATTQGSWVRLDLKGVQSNPLGMGARVLFQEGDLRVVREARAGNGHLTGHDRIVHAGLGVVDGQLDAIEIYWPSGIRQVLTSVDLNVTIPVTEDASSKTSCPLLFVWDGSGMRFVSDVTGNAYTGWLVAPGFHHPPDPDELVRVDGLAARDGVFDIRLLEALEETDYVDEVDLVAVDHPAGLEVLPDEAFQLQKPYRGFGLVPLVEPRVVAGAWDGQGADVLDLVSRIDRRYPPVSELPPPLFLGYAQPHTFTFDLGPVDTAGRVQLAAWGWIYYPMEIPKLVVEGPYIAPQPQRLEALDPATGQWVPVSQDIGFPAGLPKWWTYDLTGKLPDGAREVRITTNLRVYWDQVLVDTAPAPPEGALAMHRLDPIGAELGWQGYPLFASDDGLQPATYHYDSLSPVYPWDRMTGNYTQFGDVTELVADRDDLFAIYSHGEELAVRFDADALPPVPDGMERTYFLWFDLFTKDTEPYNAHPMTVEPLPFHGMSNYPYGPGEAYPDTERHRHVNARYQTRFIQGPEVAASQQLLFDLPARASELPPAAAPS